MFSVSSDISGCTSEKICCESDFSGDRTVGGMGKEGGHKMQMYMIREGEPRVVRGLY